VLASTVFGVRFPGPLGLAAGFDKDGAGLHTWGALGFGYAEVGTVTAEPQPGNPRPRLFRLPADRALLNRMGFNNDGAGRLAMRLTRHRPDVPIGVNIGKTKVTAAAGAVDDYRTSARLVGPLASYLVVNVSSPNTPGLRDLQAVQSLRPILTAVLAETSTPVLVKIAPDLPDAEVDAVADLAVELGLAGVVATNTTVSRDGLKTPDAERLGAGGVSGPPLAHRAAEVLHRLYARVGDRLVLISVGGIEDADDAWNRIVAGASLLQGYTGFVYGGGSWAKHIHDGIAGRLCDGGFSTLREAVGSATRSP
jgi:dihydroorotate dehydrogenase